MQTGDGGRQSMLQMPIKICSLLVVVVVVMTTRSPAGLSDFSGAIILP